MDVLINNNIIKEINLVDNNNNNNIEEETNGYFCSMQMVGTLDQKRHSSCYFSVITPLLSFIGINIVIIIIIIGINSLAVRVRGGIGNDDGITFMLSAVPPHTTGKTGEPKKFERNATGVTVDTRLEHQNKPVSFADHQDRQRQL
jgi:hypothetical protein